MCAFGLGFNYIMAEIAFKTVSIRNVYPKRIKLVTEFSQYIVNQRIRYEYINYSFELNRNFPQDDFSSPEPFTHKHDTSTSSCR